MKVLVLGRDGQLGSALKAISPSTYKTTFLSRTDVDLSDLSSLRKAVLSYRPVLVVNAAAYTAVDRAETEESMAFRVNAEAPGVIASACNEIGAVLIHFSTDYVFDGDAKLPYREDAPTNPLGTYGQSKLAGEIAVSKASERYIIIRTAWLYSLNGQNFLKTMLRLARSDEEVRVVSDQIGSPTFASDLAYVTWSIIDSLLHKQIGNFGLYHVANYGAISWHRFASEIFEIIGLNDIAVKSILTTEYPTPAPRPRFTALSCDLVNDIFGITMPDWRDAVSRCLRGL